MRRAFHIVLVASLLAFPSQSVEAGEANFEIAAGAYVADSGLIGDQTALGVRGGYRFTDRWAIQGSLSRTELFDVHVPFVDVDGDATFFDVSAMYFITPRRKAELFVYGGVGMARFDVGVGRIRFNTPLTGRVNIPGFGVTVDDEFTTHLGLGVNIRLNEKMYLRPDLRSRWLSDFDGGSVDFEPSLSLGWNW